MVTSVGNIADLFNDKKRVEQLEKEFIARRNLVHNEVLASPRAYLEVFNTEQLREQIFMYNGLALEVSKLDDEYKIIRGFRESDPNYQQLMVMYNGIRNIIRREIHNRRCSEI